MYDYSLSIYMAGTLWTPSKRLIRLNALSFVIINLLYASTYATLTITNYYH